MGITLCPRHGRKGITFVCPHVRQAVLGGLPPPRLSKATADFEELTFEASLCAGCAASAVADGAALKRAGEQALDWFHGLNLEPICPGCLEEACRGGAGAGEGTQ
jgi:hypothetical protein